MEIKWIHYFNYMNEDFQISEEKKRMCLNRKEIIPKGSCVVAIKVPKGICYWYTDLNSIYNEKINENYVPCVIIKESK